MPPFLPRKRHSPSPPTSARKPPTKKARLADALDAESSRNAPGLAKTRTFSLGSDSSSDSSLSEVDSDQFEDVPVTSKASGRPGVSNVDEDEKLDDEDDDDEVEWEDAAATTAQDTSNEPLANGPIQLTFRKDDEPEYTMAASGAKKGPTRREKQARIDAHRMHVQFLLWHNAVRNQWIEDRDVQKTLVKQLPVQIVKEVDRWKRASGLLPPDPQSHQESQQGKRRKRSKAKSDRSQRDWGQPSSRLEAGKPDMSHGDPIIPMMKILTAYWKKRFAITAPGLRKKGYGTKHGLKKEIQSWRNDGHDHERHGERILGIEDFRNTAAQCEGSRDVGAQLFTALLRGLDIEARMVASLQPTGFGWTKVEQSLPGKDGEASKSGGQVPHMEKSVPRASSKATTAKSSRKPKTKPSVIDLDTDANDDAISLSDNDSVVDVTPSMPVQRKAKYDHDLTFPIYWTEAISPITSKVLPVSPLVLENPVASTPEFLTAFEPRGAKAEKNKQVMAYVVAYSSDGTAKDVTVRYLRKRIWPGKTKGFRFPVEKVPVYDERGRVKRYEDYDWAKHVISLWGRSTHKRRPVDDVEDATDLVPFEPERKGDGGVDTLQSLKASADFVLERFLRREEALRPGASPDRMFISGKGDKQKEEPVYRRADVERCLTAESWHKEGRRPQLGEHPMKIVPVRAVTLTRKREAEEHERVTGEKQMQGLYSWDQTEWIIPEPIQDGIIPKNAYGNMDCFVPSMVPQGAVHIPLKGTVRICKKLEIDFAEAVTGFEFGNKRAVPVCTGVVVAKENEKMVKDAWRAWNEEQRQKQETKMEKLVLDLWKKFVVGLRIRERVAEQYGEELGVFVAPTGLDINDPIDLDDENDENPKTDNVGGGFVEEDGEFGGGFLLPHEDDVSEREELVMDEHDANSPKKGWNSAAKELSSFPTSIKRSPTSRITSPMSKEESDSNQDDESEDEPMDFLPAQRARKRPPSSDSISDAKLVNGHDSVHPPLQKVSPEAKLNKNHDAEAKDVLDSESEVEDQANKADDAEEAEDEAGEDDEVYIPRSTRHPRRTTKPSLPAEATSPIASRPISPLQSSYGSVPLKPAATAITRSEIIRASSKSKQKSKHDRRKQTQTQTRGRGRGRGRGRTQHKSAHVGTDDEKSTQENSDDSDDDMDSSDSGVDVTPHMTAKSDPSTSSSSSSSTSTPLPPPRTPNNPRRRRTVASEAASTTPKPNSTSKKVRSEGKKGESKSKASRGTSATTNTNMPSSSSRSRSARLMKRENSRVTSPYF